ncbi:FAD binding domain-containing protein [Aquabacter cavernae]|uniref:FAD binding domain-containing protein n=1 Tax=Aquabacter cavernae TaxID=2496029 RepID=UPI000F8F667A|nr:xanthine dehydrogenase family protein subunit M [Aquabacter cavernae]
MYAFDYQRPSFSQDAVSMMRSLEEPKLLAGGQTLLPTLKQRLAQPGTLVDLSRIPDLSGISVAGDVLRIGAMTRHAEVATSDLVHAHSPALAELAGMIGDPAVRNRGTIGGSLANNDPSADYPAAALALGATLVTDRRRLAASDFFRGLFETALEEDELILAVEFPKSGPAAYRKFRNPASRYAMAGVFVVRGADGVRVAVTGVGQEGVFRWKEAEAALTARFAPDALEGIALDPHTAMSDLHGDGAYRAQLTKVMARRAVEAIGG